MSTEQQLREALEACDVPEQYRHAIMDKFAALSQPSQPMPEVAPKGWKLVPVVPTPEMKRAAVVYANGNAVYKNVAAGVLEIEEGIYGETYEAMLSASPAVPEGANPDQQSVGVCPEAGLCLESGEFVPAAKLAAKPEQTSGERAEVCELLEKIQRLCTDARFTEFLSDEAADLFHKIKNDAEQAATLLAADEKVGGEAVASIYMALYGNSVCVEYGHSAKHYKLDDCWVCVKFNSPEHAIAARKALKQLNELARPFLSPDEFTSPQQAAQVALTDQQIISMRKGIRHDMGNWACTLAFARAVEAAHGITGEDQG